MPARSEPRRKVVLDASALLAFLFRETGHETVAEHLSGAALSAVNLSEVLSRFVRDGHAVDDLTVGLLGVGIEVHPFDELQAALAASLVPIARPLGLSLGDRACLALALTLEKPALTADQAWTKLTLDIPVQLIR